MSGVLELLPSRRNNRLWSRSAAGRLHFAARSISGRSAVATVLLALSAIALDGTSAVYGETTDPVGAVGKYYLPLPTPSADTTPKTFVMNGQTYVIPRNYIETLSVDDKDGSAAVISMRAVLPDFSGLTQDTIPCGVGYQHPCSAKVVIIGLTRGLFSTSGRQQLENTKGISHPNEGEGPCGLKYYESFGSIDNGGVVFQSFFTKFPGEADLSLVSCSKPGSTFAQRCNGRENVGDGNSVYYNFDRAKLCEWGDIRAHIFDLLKSFRSG